MGSGPPVVRRKSIGLNSCVEGSEILRRKENSSWPASAALVECLGDKGDDLSTATADKHPG